MLLFIDERMPKTRLKKLKKKIKIKIKDKKKSKLKPKARPIRKVHHSYLKKMILTDETKPDGVKANPFIVKNRSISHRVNSIIIGIQQPIVQLLGLNADTWYKQYCDPLSKTIFLEVYDKEKNDNQVKALLD